MRYTLTFGSTHKVLKAESVLNDADAAFRLDPAPSGLNALCELVITVEEAALEDVMDALASAGQPPAAIYRKEGESYVEV